LTVNVGKAEAVRQGLRMALDSSVQPPPAYVAYWDADLATPLETLLGFRDVLRRLPAVQLVMGCRMPLLGHAIRRHWLRARLGQIFACLASLVLRAPVHDTQCGAKMFRVSSELPTMLAAPFSSRWIFDLELLMRLKQQRTPVRALRSAVFEYPLESWEEVAGSKVKGRDFVRAARELATIYYRYSTRPMVPEPMTSSPQPILPVPAAHHHDSDQVPLAQPRRRSA
jgi:dolichyl-phosphate beta-glucosyltransferase